MIITIIVKNVIKRGNTYHFRLSVPADCREAIAKSEITKSLKTEDEAEAALLAKKETAFWKQEFKVIRKTGKLSAPSISNTGQDVVAELRDTPIPQPSNARQKHAGKSMPSAPSNHTSPSLRSGPEGIVSDVLEECLTAKKRTYKAEQDIKREVASLLEWLKLDAASTPIDSITAKNIMDYRDHCLTLLPKNARRMPDTKNLAVHEQVAYGKKHDCERISITTINNRLVQCQC